MMMNAIAVLLLTVPVRAQSTPASTGPATTGGMPT